MSLLHTCFILISPTYVSPEMPESVSDFVDEPLRPFGYFSVFPVEFTLGIDTLLHNSTDRKFSFDEEISFGLTIFLSSGFLLLGRATGMLVSEGLVLCR